jgi:hypothetical protein
MSSSAPSPPAPPGAGPTVRDPSRGSVPRPVPGDDPARRADGDTPIRRQTTLAGPAGHPDATAPSILVERRGRAVLADGSERTMAGEAGQTVLSTERS